MFRALAPTPFRTLMCLMLLVTYRRDKTMQVLPVVVAERPCYFNIHPRIFPEEIQSVYLNCEDFKHHSFPNVLIEILDALFHELENNLSGWFGKKRRSRQLIFEHIAADPAEAVYRDPNRHPFLPLRATRPAPQRAFFEGKLDCGSKRSAIGVQPILLAASLPRLRKGQCSNFQQPFEEGLFLSHPRPDRIRRSL